jgi:hypothetical protein
MAGRPPRPSPLVLARVARPAGPMIIPAATDRRDGRDGTVPPRTLLSGARPTGVVIWLVLSARGDLAPPPGR